MSDILEWINELLGLTDVQFVTLLTLLSFLLTWPLGRWVTRRWTFKDLTESGEGIGSYCNVIGILYAIVLGYVLVNAYESYSAADMAVETESALLIDILRDAEGLPFRDGLALRIATLRYIDSVTKLEWPHMIKYNNSHPDTFEKFADLYHVIRAVKCESDEQRIFLTEVVEKLNDLSTTRFTRLMASGARVPNMLWGMIVFVGLITLNLCFYFPVENNRLRIYFLACTASVMTFTTLLIYVLDRPFSGSLGIQPTSIVQIIENLKSKGVERVFRSRETDVESLKSLDVFKDLLQTIAPGQIKEEP